MIGGTAHYQGSPTKPEGKDNHTEGHDRFDQSIMDSKRANWQDKLEDVPAAWDREGEQVRGIYIPGQ
jgi:hypothetical protein